MSFNSKNLSYESKEPSFLRRLKSQYVGGDPQKHVRSTVVPSRLRGEEDDEPTYVEEGTNVTLTKAEYEAMAKGESTENKPKTPASSEELSRSDISEPEIKAETRDEKIGKAKEIVAGIGGAQKKRKPVKAVGEEEEDEEVPAKDRKTPIKKAKRPKKAIKLSFDQDD